jgi:hypothetical protein
MQFIGSKQTFQRNMQPSYSESMNKPRKEVALSSQLLDADFLLGLFFDLEVGGVIFLRDVCVLSTEYTPLYVRR